MQNGDRAGGRPVLLVCSTGGHLLQLLELRPAWEDFPRVWVTFAKSDSASLLHGERVVHAHGPTNRSIPNLLRNLRLAVRVMRTERPAAILTTGAGITVPFAWIGRLFGVPTVYVESFTRIDAGSRQALAAHTVATLQSETNGNGDAQGSTLLRRLARFIDRVKDSRSGPRPEPSLPEGGAPAKGRALAIARKPIRSHTSTAKGTPRSPGPPAPAAPRRA